MVVFCKLCTEVAAMLDFLESIADSSEYEH